MITHLMNQVSVRVRGVGKIPICNLRADRAPHIGNFCLPLCWRCTAIATGIIVFKQVLSKIPLTGVNQWIPLFVAGLMILPTAIDGVRQYIFKRESTNVRRIWTGLSCGCGLALLLVYDYM